MFQIHPTLEVKPRITHLPDTQLEHQELILQGIHVVSKAYAPDLDKTFFVDLPTGQSALEGFVIDINDKKTYNNVTGKPITTASSHSQSIESLLNPQEKDIQINIEKINEKKEVIILNTLDSCYGHSLLFLMNIQNIKRNKPEHLGIVVLVQPMFRWLVPEEWVDEIWTVKMSLAAQRNYFPALSQRFNTELKRFDKAFISKAHLVPTQKPIDIEKFTKLKPYKLKADNKGARITYIWREDFGRLWIKSPIVYGACKVLRIRPILRYVHYLRVLLFFTLIRRFVTKDHKLTVAGAGEFGKFPKFIEDIRTVKFTDEEELRLGKTYSESMIIVGVHGSSMLLPSALAGMTVCLMPFMKWPHLSEDIIYTETDIRLAALNKRYVPLSTSMIDVLKIVYDLVFYAKYNEDKFKYDENEL